MIELIAKIFSKRQAATVEMLWERFLSILKSGGLSPKKLIALLLAFGQIFTVLVFDLGMKPRGQGLDLNQFELVWSDEFDGNEVNLNNWGGHYVWGGAEIRQGGFWHESMASVNDGCLTIKTEYLPEGAGGKGPGYYSYGMDTRGRYEQCYGYFEVRCKMPAAHGLWAAFWLLNDETYNEDGSGMDGTEVDVFESGFYKDVKYGMENSIVSGIVFDGYGEASQGATIGKYRVCGDIYEEFHTYGLEWNEDWYIFYIDGVESGRTNFGGVSRNPEWLILSVEVSGRDGVASGDKHGTGVITDTEKWPANFVVDYVRAYQYKSLLPAA